jgi:non-ribosomal peptide synthetase component F
MAPPSFFTMSERGGGSQLASFLADECITVYHSVPSVFRHFTASLTDRDNFTALRLIHLAGEAIDTRVIARVRETFAMDLPVRTLFERPTVAGLVDSLDTMCWIATRSGRDLQSSDDIEERTL